MEVPQVQVLRRDDFWMEVDGVQVFLLFLWWFYELHLQSSLIFWLCFSVIEGLDFFDILSPDWIMRSEERRMGGEMVRFPSFDGAKYLAWGLLVDWILISIWFLGVIWWWFHYWYFKVAFYFYLSYVVVEWLDFLHLLNLLGLGLVGCLGILIC